MLYGVAFIFIFTVGGLSGVLLSNASLDIAFHDTLKVIVILSMMIYLIKFINYKDLYNTIKESPPARCAGQKEYDILYSEYLKKINNLSNEYIIYFFLGLLEGDGTITVDLTKWGTTRVRIIISILNKPENVEMLNLIKSKIKGRVIIERNNKYVTWIMSNKKGVLDIFLLIEKYGLLTKRKYSQYMFAKKCLNNNNNKLTINEFKILRDNKYNIDYKFLIKKDIINSFYFKGWLSGFIEAEGNFNLILNKKSEGINTVNFNIGQKDDYKILELIRDYFKCNTLIIKDKKLYKDKLFYYRFYLYNKNTRKLLFDHIFNFPLLGEKRVSFIKWYYYFYKYNKI